VRVDGADLLRTEPVQEAAAALPGPATLLWAPRGMADLPPGLYDDHRLARLGAGQAGISTREVPETNHDSILWAPHGAEAIAGAVREAARADPAG
jgi:hypothetical protein